MIFIERSASSPYYVKEHPYTQIEFAARVSAFIEKGREFREALGIDVTSQDFRKFRAAALSLIDKDSKSHKPGKQLPSKA